MAVAIPALSTHLAQESYALPAPLGGFILGYHEFSGKFLGQGRDFKLDATIKFWSAKHFNPISQSYLWSVQLGCTVDGASIPKFAWSIVGGPFSGAYRLSSGIHDIMCSTLGCRGLVPYKIVHALFAEMIHAEGMRGRKEWYMAVAVMRGGPRW